MVTEEELLAGQGQFSLADWRARGKMKPSAWKILRAMAHLQTALTTLQIAGEAPLSLSTARMVLKALLVGGFVHEAPSHVPGKRAFRISPLGQEAVVAQKIIAAQDEGARKSDPDYLERQEIKRALEAGDVTMPEVRAMRARKRPGAHRVTRGPNGERAREMVGPHRWSSPHHPCKACGRHHTLREHRHHKHDGEHYRTSLTGALFPSDPVPQDPPFEFTMFNPLDEEMRRAERSGERDKLERLKARALGTTCDAFGCQTPATEPRQRPGEEMFNLCPFHLMIFDGTDGDYDVKGESLGVIQNPESIPVVLWRLAPGTVFRFRGINYTVVRHAKSGSKNDIANMMSYVTQGSDPRLFQMESTLRVQPVSQNPRRSRPWAKSKVAQNRTPIIPFEVFRDQEFMPLWRRAVASGLIPEAIKARNPLLAPQVLLTEQLTLLHTKNARRYAQVIPGSLVFEFALQTLWLPAAHRGGLIAHEIGHVLCPEGSEEDADRMALKALGVKISYDKRWPGKGLQKGRVVR